MPLPRYVKVELEDGERYQTVYSEEPGRSCADSGSAFHKGTAGEDSGQGECASAVTLHVGLGTFRPVKAEDIENTDTQILHNAGGDGEDHNGDEEVGRPRRLRRALFLVQDGPETLRTGDGTMDANPGWTKYLYLSGLSF